jgi:hypothetical protein
MTKNMKNNSEIKIPPYLTGFVGESEITHDYYVCSASFPAPGNGYPKMYRKISAAIKRGKRRWGIITRLRSR